jgi:hypothetical protein
MSDEVVSPGANVLVYLFDDDTPVRTMLKATKKPPCGGFGNCLN